MEPILQVENLTKQYTDFKLDHVSFNIPKGTIMGLIGENGAGKSTTINAILDLIQKDDGTVTFWGQELSSNPRQLKENIGVVFDGINFHETLTPAKVGKISAAAYKQWDFDTFNNFMRKFQLPMNKEIKTFSKGMKMKLSIAVALSHYPKLLILDEATSGLDPIMRDDILDIFLEFVQDENHSILMSSHITTDLEKIADYITFIHQGEVLFSKPKDELIYHYGIIRCGTSVFDSIDKSEVLAYRKCDYQWEVLVAEKDTAQRKYKNTVIDNATIDDILLLYVKGEQSDEKFDFKGSV
ncbi:ABC-2 type transport system ATP-binding protein [Fontibacillus panacisegetis]|uniref:ABC-2 type transport system ATP-binding protein n=1 Tax=Fontibacillus panacisegetis TaxID=670482 RepID=A0A1G7E4G3_9BACL|nr:ABC transporter ATP-binding protein [Fontibacillus panacisegetis]SDE58614.1 ABC-2 type transport system ATP-binding protein [Fontibacillus panacisegetis]